MSRSCLFICIMLCCAMVCGCVGSGDEPAEQSTPAPTTTPAPMTTQPPMTTLAQTTLPPTTGVMDAAPDISLFEEVYDHDFFVDPQTLRLNCKVVVNDATMTLDYGSGYEIALAIYNSFDIRKLYNIGDIIVYDYDLTPSQKAQYNLILVGGPISNEATWQLLQMDYITYEAWESSGGHLQYIEGPFWADKDVLVVAGNSGMCTRMAAIALSYAIRSHGEK